MYMSIYIYKCLYIVKLILSLTFSTECYSEHMPPIVIQGNSLRTSYTVHISIEDRWTGG